MIYRFKIWFEHKDEVIRWIDIKPSQTFLDFHEAIQDAIGFDKKELSSTQKEGVIVCIPKGDKPKEFIQNWRPISLLNVVYKIGASCIASRLKGVLSSIISVDQSGFVPGRYLGDNIRLIYDLMDLLTKQHKPGLLLCLDFEKAFDSVDSDFMFSVLRMFGCGPDFCQWIETFYFDNKIHCINHKQI